MSNVLTAAVCATCQGTGFVPQGRWPRWLVQQWCEDCDGHGVVLLPARRYQA